MPIGTPAGILNVLVIANTGQANRALTKTRAAFRLTGIDAERSAATSATAWKTAGLAIGLGAGAAAAASAKMAVDFDKSMRNVNSLIQLPEKQFQKLQDKALAIAGPTAQAPITIANGLYDLVSSGFDASESLTIVKQAAKGATAGLSDTATATKAVSAVLNAYHRPASDAKDVTDTLFKTVDKGVITFEELAQNIGDTLPFAASLGVKLTDVGAAVATMTKQGLSSSETMTRIRNVMQTLIKPGEDLQGTFKKLGMSGEELVKKEGLQGALNTLIGTTDGTKEAVAKLFPNIRALGGALALTGKNTQSASKDLKALQNHAGATEKALSQQRQSISFQWHQVTAEISALAIEWGQQLLPIMAGGIKIFGQAGNAIIDVGTALSGLPHEYLIVAEAMGAVALASKALIVLGPGVVAFGTSIATAGGLMATAAAEGTVLATSVELLSAAFAASPIGTLVVGAGLLTGAYFGIKSAADALFGSEKKLSPQQMRLKETSEALKKSLSAQKVAMEALDSSAKKVDRAHDRQKEASKAVAKAEKKYQAVLEKYPKNSREAVEALSNLKEAKDEERRATKRAEKAEREHGAVRKSSKPILKATLQSERDRIVTLKDAIKQTYDDIRAQNKYGATIEDRKAKQEELNTQQRQLKKALADQNSTLKDAADRIGPKFAKRIEEMTQIQLQFGKKTSQAAHILRDPFKTGVDALGRPLDLMGNKAERMGKSFQSSADVASGAINKINTDTQKAADALGISVPTFGTSSSGSGNKQKKRAGGRLVGGLGSGDKVHLMAEPGEVVWNREAVRNMGGATAANMPNKIFKRQKGGPIGQPDFGGHPSNVNSSVAKLIATMQAHFPGLGVSATTDGSHVAGSDHYSGDAVDMASASFPYMDKAAGWIMSSGLFKTLKQGIHNPNLSVNLGQVVDPSFYADVWAGHRNHIHLAITGALSGAFGAASQEIARTLITGPDGPLKDLPQAISDKIRKGANQVLAKKAGAMAGETGVGPGSVSGAMFSVPEMSKLWLKARGPASQAHVAGAVGMAESRGDPNAYNASGASGLWQILGQVVPGNIFDPMVNAVNAVKKYNDASGWSPWEAYTNGNYLQFMQMGGIVGMQDGGIIPKIGIDDIPHLGVPYVPDHGGLVNDFVDMYRSTEGAGDRRKLVSDTLQTIRGRKAFGLDDLNKDGSLTGQLASLRVLADKFQEFANNAFDLNEDTPWDLSKDLNAQLPYSVKDGDKIIKSFASEQEAEDLLKSLQDGALGRFYGKTEGEWLGGIGDDPGRLQTLLKLRNRLLDAIDRIKQVKQIVENMIETVEHQVSIVRDAIQSGEHIKKQIERQRNHLQGKLNKLDKDLEADKKTLANEVAKPKKKRDENLIDSLKKKIADWYPDQRKDIKKDLDKNHNEMQNLLGKQGDRGALMTALKDKLKPAFQERMHTLVDGAANVAEELNNTQGSVPQFDHIQGIPDFGVLGGDIFDTQKRLKELQFNPADFTDDTGDTAGGMSISDLLKFAEAVRLGAFGSTQNIPVFGTGGMSSGGYALVGDRGPEILNLPAGTQIQNNRQSQSMLPGTFVLEVSLGGEKIDERIDVKLRDEEGKELGRWRQGRTSP